LKTVTGESDRAFLVEAFNEILISRIRMDVPFVRGLDIFIEKDDLNPFEEAKLFGHNAIHALIGYIGKIIGAECVDGVLSLPGLMAFVRDAFLSESGAALTSKHQGVDLLFTPQGFREYTDDLLKRMANSFLRDRIERIIRDPERKLGWNGRLIGTMRLAVDHGVTPVRFALGAAAAVDHLNQQPRTKQQFLPDLLNERWRHDVHDSGEAEEMIRLIRDADQELKKLKDCPRGNLNNFFLKY